MSVMKSKQIKDALIQLIKDQVTDFNQRVIGYDQSIDETTVFPACMVYFVNVNKAPESVGTVELGRKRGEVTVMIKFYARGHDIENVSFDLEKQIDNAIENDKRLGSLSAFVVDSNPTGSEVLVFQEQNQLHAIVNMSVRVSYIYKRGDA